MGTCKPKTAVEYTAEDFSFLMSTNLESAYHMSQLAYPLLRASGAGSIVFISSVNSVVAINVGSTIYSATKGNFILLFDFYSKLLWIISLRETLSTFCRSNESASKKFGM